MNKKDPQNELKEKILADSKEKISLCESFTKEKLIDQVEAARKVYDAEPTPNTFSKDSKSGSAAISDILVSRYKTTIPIVFNNVESYKASFSDNLPEIMLSGRGKKDENKAQMVEAVYEYIKQKCHLEEFIEDAAELFFNEGFVASYVSFNLSCEEVPVLDEFGKPMIDEKTNEKVCRQMVTDDDPVIELIDNTKCYYHPASKFSNKGDEVPMFFWKKYLSVQEVRKTYGIECEADTNIDLEEKDDNKKKKETVEVIFMVGYLDDSYENLVENYDPQAIYIVVRTKDKLLAVEKERSNGLSLGKLFGRKFDFFGYGLGKRLAPNQFEASLRRQQSLRLADVAAYQKWLIKNDGTNDLDFDKLSDPRALPFLQYTSEPPRLSEQPSINQVVSDSENKARQEAQETSGVLDLSAGSQQSTVKTATGQAMFLDASGRIVRQRKKRLSLFYVETVKKALKKCQENWQTDKIVTITDETGNELEVTLNKESLADIDFDQDIIFELETPNTNKDILRAQAIEFYEKLSPSPIANQKEMIKFVMEKGFNQKNPDRFLKEDNQNPPGTVLVNPQTGENFIIDEGGNLVSQEMEQTTSEASGSPVPSDQAQYNASVLTNKL